MYSRGVRRGETIETKMYGVPVLMERSPRASRTRIVAKADHLLVVVPRRAHGDAAAQALTAHDGWVKRHAASILARQTELAGMAGTLLLRGERLQVTRGARVSHGGGEIMVPVSWDLQRLESWLKDQARIDASALLERRAAEMAVTYRRLILRDSASRWGTCSAVGNIGLNWRLVMAPPDVLDYVVVHELAHLRHMNHSKAYWASVEEFCPRHREHRAWLKESGWMLKLAPALALQAP